MNYPLLKMIPDNQHDLESQVDRLLKGLPEVSAPRTLMPRVMARVRSHAALPWYRQSLRAWPMSLQIVTILVLVASFGGFFIATWELSRAAGYAAAKQEVAAMFSWVTVAGNILGVLISAIRLVVERLGTAFIIGCVAAAALAYSIFIGLGTVYLRLAFSQRQ
jgi:hypothetical protein